MQDKNNIQSILKLDRLLFDKIEFRRFGFQNDKEIELEIESNISQKPDTNIYKVTLTLKGNKPDEYAFEISLVGFFIIDDSKEIPKDLKNNLISINTIAIMMPYLRSEVSLLTAQPGMDCVVLPAFDIHKMVEN